MKYLDLTFRSPERNLACDEALLDRAEETGRHEVLRLWEPRSFCVVVGYSTRIASEVNLSFCRKGGIPVLRRFSGGGAVVIGPGCLNFSLILGHDGAHPRGGAAEGYDFVLGRHREAFEALLSREIGMEGVSDLTIEGRKFSGNSQHRKRRSALFHGTILLDLDISLVERCLRMPSRQPSYRRNRSHGSFLTNLALSSDLVRGRIRETWNATRELDDIPHERIDELVARRYSREDWNGKF